MCQLVFAFLFLALLRLPRDTSWRQFRLLNWSRQVTNSLLAVSEVFRSCNSAAPPESIAPRSGESRGRMGGHLRSQQSSTSRPQDLRLPFRPRAKGELRERVSCSQAAELRPLTAAVRGWSRKNSTWTFGGNPATEPEAFVLVHE